MADVPPKSAYELAMERLRRQDAEAGVVDAPVTDEMRAAIAETRSFYEAKIAEVKILHQSALVTARDPEARAQLDDAHRRDVQRLGEERDRKIARIREGR
jgi:fructose-1,6-bisphosphatase/inositol monophosphatase family enzyme